MDRWIVCDTGVKLMRIAKTEQEPGKGLMVYGYVYSPRMDRWTKTLRWRRAYDNKMHIDQKVARQAWRDWKAARKIRERQIAGLA